MATFAYRGLQGQERRDGEIDAADRRAALQRKDGVLFRGWLVSYGTEQDPLKLERIPALRNLYLEIYSGIFHRPFGNRRPYRVERYATKRDLAP